jgi:hypothetical protein
VDEAVARRVPVGGAPRTRRDGDAGADDGVEQDAVEEHQRHLAADHRARLPLRRLMAPSGDGVRAAAMDEDVEQAAAEEEEADVDGDDQQNHVQRGHTTMSLLGP